MDNDKMFLRVLLLFSLIAYVTIMVFDLQPTDPVQYDFDLACPEPVCPEPVVWNTDCPSPCPTCELPLFAREAKNVAEAHDWDENEYMCCDFSIELFERLRADGYEADICQGQYHNQSHCWVCIGSICMESVTGKVIRPIDYERYYEPERCTDFVPWKLHNWVESYGRRKNSRQD